MTSGGVVGPTVAGILFDEFGFRGASVFIVILDSILVGLVVFLVPVPIDSVPKNHRQSLVFVSFIICILIGVGSRYSIFEY